MSWLDAFFNTGNANVEVRLSALGTINVLARYLAYEAESSKESATQVRMSGAGTLTLFRIVLGLGPTVGHTTTWTVRKNGVDTGLVVTIVDTALSGYSTGSVSYVDGDMISVKQVPDGSVDNLTTDPRAIISGTAA